MASMESPRGPGPTGISGTVTLGGQPDQLTRMMLQKDPKLQIKELRDNDIRRDTPDTNDLDKWIKMFARLLRKGSQGVPGTNKRKRVAEPDLLQTEAQARIGSHQSSQDGACLSPDSGFYEEAAIAQVAGPPGVQDLATPIVGCASPTVTVPASPTSTVAPRASHVQVQLPLTKLQRVRDLKLRCHKQLKALEIIPSKSETEKLHDFVGFVSGDNQVTLFGRQLPRCHLYLVQIKLDSAAVQSYICIEGLETPDDIRDFYSVMSQTRYREHYKPLKLCFRMVEVSSTASVTAKVRCRMHADEITLCGTPVRVTTDLGEQFSTIGGLVEVDGALFALTTAHAPPEMQTDSVVPSESASSAAREEDFPDDVQEALVIEYPERAAEKAPPDFEALTEWPVKVEAWHENERDDWRLIPVNEYCLPNYVWVGSDRQEGAKPEPCFIVGHLPNPSGRRVYIMAGVSGGHLADMSAGPSFLFGKAGPQEVWTAHLRGDSDLMEGDSGSWVVATPTPGLGLGPGRGQVVGMVVARCAGKAFITLLSGHLDSIRQNSNSPKLASLPLPLPLLLRLSHQYHQSGDAAKARKCIALILSLVRQQAPSRMPFAPTPKRNIADFEQHDLEAVTNLEQLIARYGLLLQEMVTSGKRHSTATNLSLGQEQTLSYLISAHWSDRPAVKSTIHEPQVREPMMTEKFTTPADMSTPILPSRGSQAELPSQLQSMVGKFPQRLNLSPKVVHLWYLGLLGFYAGVGVGTWKLATSSEITTEGKICIGIAGVGVPLGLVTCLCIFYFCIR